MLGTNRLAVWEELFCVLGEPLLAYLVGIVPRKRWRPSSDAKTTTKGRKTLATTRLIKFKVDGFSAKEIQDRHTALCS
jgi:hypothetical protein